MKRIVAFDFDGTLTRKDTFVELLRFAGGSVRLYATLLLYAPLLVLMRLRLYSNQKVKQRIFARYFGGMAVDTYTDLCRRFYLQRGQRLLKPEPVRTLHEHQRRGDTVVIITASTETWVQYFAEVLGVKTVIATQAEVKDGIMTGRFSSANCYGQEKVNRLLKVFPDRNNYYLIAFGDSRGDNELLQFADEAHVL